MKPMLAAFLKDAGMVIDGSSTTTGDQAEEGTETTTANGTTIGATSTTDDQEILNQTSSPAG